MRGLKLGVLMLAVLGAVTFGGYAANAAVSSYQDPSVAEKISELLAQIKWLQEELLKLQAEVGSGQNPTPTQTMANVGSEFNLPQNQTVAINVTPQVTVKNISQIMCFTTPCPTAFNILVHEDGKADKNVTVGYNKIQITDKLEMVFVRYDYDHENPYGKTIFKVTYIIPTPTRNLPPVISGLSGPTTLKVGETGTFKINAYDPENKTLNYLIKWGDEPTNSRLDYSGAMPTSVSTTQNSTYTHSYANAGNYTINILVSDDVGNTAQSSITVNVSNNQSLRVLYPNGGESFSRYANININWTDINEPVNIYVSRDYPTYDCTYGYVCPMTAMYPNSDTLIFSNLLPDTNNDVDYVNWQVGTSYYGDNYNYYDYIPDGNYKIKVCGVTSGVCDSSDYIWNIYSWAIPNNG